MTPQDATTPDEIPKEVKEAITEAFNTYETISVTHKNDTPFTILEAEVKEENAPVDHPEDPYNSYVIGVNCVGVLELETILDDQGRLMYLGDRIEISLYGFSSLLDNSRIAVEVKETRAEPHQ